LGNHVLKHKVCFLFQCPFIFSLINWKKFRFWRVYIINTRMQRGKCTLGFSYNLQNKFFQVTSKIVIWGSKLLSIKNLKNKIKNQALKKLDKTIEVGRGNDWYKDIFKFILADYCTVNFSFCFVFTMKWSLFESFTSRASVSPNEQISLCICVNIT
jgi:hypothetical protein